MTSGLIKHRRPWLSPPGGILAGFLLLTIVNVGLHVRDQSRNLAEDFAPSLRQQTSHVSSLSRSAVSASGNPNATIPPKPPPAAPAFPGRPGDSACRLLPPGASASSLWTSLLDEILSASVASHPASPPAPETERLLRTAISPARLRRAVRSRSFIRASVARAAEIIAARLADPANNPPLRVAVLGGSVTIGRGCGSGMADRECAWPARAEKLINSLAGADIVRVTNLGNGGTSTSQGSVTIKYGMYPGELAKSGPDLIINSFSANDSLPPGWWLKGDEKPETIGGVRDSAWKSNQDFVRTALSSNPCGTPPLVIHVDDYLGHQQDPLLGEMQYNNAMSQLSRWYGTGLVSYADAVRDLVYQDTSETTFSPPWPVQKDKTLKVDVHFGPAAHQVIAWAVAFAAIDAAVDYCGDAGHPTGTAGDGGLETNEWALPPPLDPNLMLHDVTEMWRKSAKEAAGTREKLCDGEDGGGRRENPCVVAARIGPSGFTAARQFNTYIQPFLSSNDGWGWEDDMKGYGWTNKLGWVAKRSDAKFVLTLKDLDRPVRLVTLIYMRSYGDKWEGSAARFTAHVSRGGDGGGEESTATTVSGHHNTTASVSFTEVMELEGRATAGMGDTLVLEVELVGGATFKIQGLMLCSF